MSSEPRWRSQEGNVLLLMPVAVLVVVVLGAIAVDFSIVYLGEREASDLAASLANDAIGAVDEPEFYGRDDAARFVIDEDRVAVLVAARVAARRRLDDGFRLVGEPVFEVEGGRTIRVTVTAEVPLIFSRAVPGAPRTALVSATAVVDAVER